MESKKPLLHWTWYHLGEMHPLTLYDMLALRESIFVVEQNCIYHELDGLDKTALHLVAVLENEVVACLRVLEPDDQDSPVRIGRVAVAINWRGKGIAREMVQIAINKAQQLHPSCRLYVEAQSYLAEFYQSMGFKQSGIEFLEDGIPHLPMFYAR